MNFQLTANALNHLFVQNSWAMTKLAPFASKVIRFQLTPFSVLWIISPGGTLRNAEPNSNPDVTCSVPPSLVPRFMLFDNKAFDDLHFQGDPGLIEALRYVFRNLRWDVAEDLSRITGDVAAERIVQTAHAAKELNPLRVLNPVRHLDERAIVVPQSQLTNFAQQIEQLNNDLAKLEQRIQHLA